MFRYTVRASFGDPAVADEWVTWLRDEHLAEVIAAGARAGEVVRLDGTPVECEVCYRFDSRTAFDRYERDRAPRLRADGLARFPIERGIAYARSTGVIEAESG